MGRRRADDDDRDWLRRALGVLTATLVAATSAAGMSGGAVAAPGAAAPADSSGIPWVVYYSDKAPVEELLSFELLVLDSIHHPPLDRLQDRHRVLMGYLSVGEVEEHRPWFAKVKGWGILGAENPNWPGSYYVDVRDKRWVKLVVEELVPALIHKGFDGVFLDTLDNPPDLERNDPARWGGMTKAAARLVKSIRRNWPDVAIMQNRGYELLPETAGAIDYALGESVYTTWNFALERAELQAPENYRFQVDALKAAKAINPALHLMSLDYWDPDDTRMIRDIYATERGNGFSPYVSVVKLDRVLPEPEP